MEPDSEKPAEMQAFFCLKFCACSERACPRWAAKRPRNQTTEFCLEERGGWIRAAAPPSAGKPAHYSFHQVRIQVIESDTAKPAEMRAFFALGFIRRRQFTARGDKALLSMSSQIAGVLAAASQKDADAKSI